MGEGQEHITQLLLRYSGGDSHAVEELLPAVYAELKRLAQSYMRRENPRHTLQATALVHEAYLKLVDQTQTQWQNRAHFFGVAAQIMRRILVDHARAKKAVKRGGTKNLTSFNDDLRVEALDIAPSDLIALDAALEKLERLNSRQAKVVELRFFGGLSIEETAESLKASVATVKRDWQTAKAWLYRELASDS